MGGGLGFQREVQRSISCPFSFTSITFSTSFKTQKLGYDLSIDPLQHADTCVTMHDWGAWNFTLTFLFSAYVYSICHLLTYLNYLPVFAYITGCAFRFYECILFLFSLCLCRHPLLLFVLLTCTAAEADTDEDREKEDSEVSEAKYTLVFRSLHVKVILWQPLYLLLPFNSALQNMWLGHSGSW